MSRKVGPPPIVFILLFFALLGGSYWWFFKRQPAPNGQIPPAIAPAPTDNATVPNNTVPPVSPVAANNNAALPAPTRVPSGTTVRIDGATSMVTINQNLKQAFERLFPGTTVNAIANGTDLGIQDLLTGKVDIAAVSRSLTPQEQSQGLVAVPVAKDAIAIVVGKSNPFTGSLTIAQVADIFQGKVNTWSAVGGSGGNIKVVNRPAISGTYKSFQEMVLKGGNFGTTPNITILPRDGTTILFQALGTDGIGYATYDQGARQTTVRVVPIDGLTPDSPAYPYQRQLYYVYKNPSSPGVQAFLGYATSPQGQQALVLGN